MKDLKNQKYLFLKWEYILIDKFLFLMRRYINKNYCSNKYDKKNKGIILNSINIINNITNLYIMMKI